MRGISAELLTHLFPFLGIQIVIGVEEGGDDAREGCEKAEAWIGGMVGLHKGSSERSHSNTLLFF